MQVNGEQVTLETPVSVADYLEAHGFRAERVAIELNGEITVSYTHLTLPTICSV